MQRVKEDEVLRLSSGALQGPEVRTMRRKQQTDRKRKN
jgi:hypothetical protein